MSAFWGQKTFCLVTGASRGIGKTIAVEFAKKVEEGSIFVLVARTTSALEATKVAVEEASGKKVKVVTATMDLEKPNREDYLSLVNSALTQNAVKADDFEHSILVHNAGSLGNTAKRIVDMDDLGEIQSYLTLNISSMILLTSQFFKVFNNASKQRSMVQITSLSAIQPMKTWGFYCMGKACRDMIMKSAALESGIQVLNWAPGPVDTEMFDQALTKTGDPDVTKAFTECKEQGNVLTTEQTITKLVRVLGEKKYVNGEHVDYFDVE